MTTLTVLLQNGGAALVPGVRAFIRSPRGGRIVLGYLGSRTAGSLTVDVLSGSSPDTAVSITGGAPLTLSSAAEIEDAALAGWATSVPQGAWIGFEVLSASGVTSATVGVKVATSVRRSNVYFIG